MRGVQAGHEVRDRSGSAWPRRRSFLRREMAYLVPGFNPFGRHSTGLANMSAKTGMVLLPMPGSSLVVSFDPSRSCARFIHPPQRSSPFFDASRPSARSSVKSRLSRILNFSPPNRLLRVHCSGGARGQLTKSAWSEGMVGVGAGSASSAAKFVIMKWARMQVSHSVDVPFRGCNVRCPKDQCDVKIRRKSKK